MGNARFTVYSGSSTPLDDSSKAGGSQICLIAQMRATHFVAGVWGLVRQHGAATYRNAIQRPAATMPNHNRIEQQPANFAPAGVTGPSSQPATRR